MENNEHRSWLNDEHRIILYTFISLVAFYGGWRQYNTHQESLLRARRVKLVENTKRNKERLASHTIVQESQSDASHITEQLKSTVLKVPEVEDADARNVASTSSKTETSQPKRSKERRRRGRDIVKDLAKLEKKVGKKMNNGNIFPIPGSSGSGPGSASSRSLSRTGSTLDEDSAIETPRAPSSSRLSAALVNEYMKIPDITEPDAPVCSHHELEPEHEVVQELTILSPTPQNIASSESSLALGPYPLPPRRTRSQRKQYSQHDSDDKKTSRPSSSADYPSDASSSAPFIAVDKSSPSPSHLAASATLPAMLGSAQSEWQDGVSKLPHSLSHPKSLSTTSTASLVASDSSWDYDAQSQSSSHHRKSPPPRFRSRSRASMSPLPMTSSTTSESFMFPSLNQTPPPNASFSTQMASYKGALEASRLREEKYKHDLEAYSKECDILRWRWNEEAAAWKRREAELQTHIHHLTHQLHAISSVTSSPTHLQPFMSQQPQLSPHGHSGFPFLPGIPFASPFGFPQPQPQPQPQPGVGNMPYPFIYPFPSTPPTTGPSSTASPTREGKHGVGSGDSNAESDGTGFSEELAEAILKRPESIRSPTSVSRSSSTSRSASVLGRATRNGFTFASLSELGNPQLTKVAGDAEGDPGGSDDEQEGGIENDRQNGLDDHDGFGEDRFSTDPSKSPKLVGISAGGEEDTPNSGLPTSGRRAPDVEIVQ